MDFTSGLPLTPIKKDFVWVIVDHLTESAYFIPVQTDYSLQKLVKLYIFEIVLGPKLVSKTEDKVRLIRDRPKAISDRQKSYVDLKKRDIEYSMGDFVFLKVSPWKEVLRFGCKELDRIHDVFHVFMLMRYWSDPSHVVSIEEIEIRPDLKFKEEPIQTLDQDVKMLMRKYISLVKVLWRNHGTEKATWEPKDSMRKQYPYLFESEQVFYEATFHLYIGSLPTNYSDKCHKDTMWCVGMGGCFIPHMVILKHRRVGVTEAQQ
ncbi:uncharacterized protein LOC108471484 [Gossypium arboreum]|uniref:uncharacterized protein LOC108471484 n=1 Tax=Gossypium arboreum TaxID=29729 RepID=UPI000819675F|nr:uncharacterized protein LOC108471484 [Gossypium arboreum]